MLHPIKLLYFTISCFAKIWPALHENKFRKELCTQKDPELMEPLLLAANFQHTHKLSFFQKLETAARYLQDFQFWEAKKEARMLQETCGDLLLNFIQKMETGIWWATIRRFSLLMTQKNFRILLPVIKSFRKQI